ncbi:class I SAM-dependent methyltransferase [Candidatus Saccharibacteria bacterium]|nr:class I SAM-dependent methyltransferase [Candidatus Saccharibacteria bacterium]
MVRNNGLFDPVERHRMMREDEFTKYTEIRYEQLKTGEQTNLAKIKKIGADFCETHKGVSPLKVIKMWNEICPALRQNAGLTEFTLDYDGAKSEFFFPWLKSVATSPSAALEMSYGAGYDIAGEWVDAVPEDDPIDGFVRDDPTFVYNRERQLYVADLVTTLQKQATSKRKSKVIDLGAGQMAWARWHGFKFDPKRQEIRAFDKDVHIEPKRLFDDKEIWSGLVYQHCDMRKALTQPECMDADLIMLGGVASYYPHAAFVQGVILPVYQLLRLGGVFFYDLQLDCPYLRRSMAVFSWPEMHFYGDATATMMHVENMRKTLWAGGLKFGAEYVLDTYNATPSSVMVVLTKV